MGVGKNLMLLIVVKDTVMTSQCSFLSKVKVSEGRDRGQDVERWNVH